MQKDFQNYIANKTLDNAKRILRRAGKISAQVIYGLELAEAEALVGSYTSMGA